MGPPPDWRVDPAAPAVPEDDPDECWVPPPCAPAPTVAPALGLLEARHARDEMRLVKTRYVITLRRARRLAILCTAAAMAPPPPAPKKKGGHPGKRARNDRLLALFEQTAPTHAHIQRCRLAARALALADALAQGIDPARMRVMKDATARDAIKEAVRWRDGARAGSDELAQDQLFTDEQPPPP